MHDRRQALRRGAALGLAAGLWNTRAFAAVYLDPEQARKVLLPQAASFRPWTPAIDPQALAQATEHPVPAGFQPAAWEGLDAQGARAGFVLTDHVIGKYEWIDYGAGFAPDGTVLGVEILAYRESHGGEVRNIAWRKQFAGRKGPGQMRFNDDIRNISGATLSSQHVTEGVQRLAALVAQQVQKPVRP